MEYRHGGCERTILTYNSLVENPLLLCGEMLGTVVTAHFVVPRSQAAQVEFEMSVEINVVFTHHLARKERRDLGPSRSGINSSRGAFACESWSHQYHQLLGRSYET